MTIQSGLLSGLRSGLRSGLNPAYTTATCTLAVAIADSADPVAGTSNFNYTVVVTVSDNAATNLVCDVQLDSALTFVSGAGTGWTVTDLGSGHIQATRASGSVGAQPTLTFTVTPTNIDDTLSTTADASADNAPVPATQDTETTTVTGQATLTVNSFTDSADPVMTAAPYSYACAIRNTSATNAATNVTCLITIPANATFVSASGTGWTCNQSGGVVTCTRASIATSTTSNTITVNVTSAAAAETSSATASASADNAAGTGNTTQTTGVQLVTKDATSGKRFPATSAEWQSLIDCNGLSVAVPTGLWLCQDASGNLAAAIGATVLTAATSPLYQQAATGLTRLTVSGHDGAADLFAIPSGTAPNPVSVSQTWMAVALMPATPATSRSFLGINLASSTAECLVKHNTSGLPDFRVVGGSNAGGVSISSTLDIHAVTHDRGNSYQAYYNSNEKIVPTANLSVTDGQKGVLRGSAAKIAYVVMWSGTNGQITSTNMKALMQALGYSPAWTP